MGHISTAERPTYKQSVHTQGARCKGPTAKAPGVECTLRRPAVISAEKYATTRRLRRRTSSVLLCSDSSTKQRYMRQPGDYGDVPDARPPSVAPPTPPPPPPSGLHYPAPPQSAGNRLIARHQGGRDRLVLHTRGQRCAHSLPPTPSPSLTRCLAHSLARCPLRAAALAADGLTQQ